jgi:putative DNA primase/helicase
MAKCPAHEDNAPSLSLRITDTGRLLAYCHAGCTFDEIREALGLSGEHFTSGENRNNRENRSRNNPTPEQIEAQAKALRIWTNSRPADPSHPYLTKKSTKPYHLKQFSEILVVPMQAADGTLWNCQLIDGEGRKKFLRGGRTKGLFTVLGEPTDSGRIYVAEGFATAATIYELTGRSVFIAFSAHNLPSVALTVRQAFPTTEIILAADADEAGERYSEEAAREVGGVIAYAGKGA